MSVSVTFSGRSPIATSRSTQASAAAPAPEVTSCTSLERLALQQQPVADRGGDGDGGAVLVVVEHRDAHARAQLRLDREALRAP